MHKCCTVASVFWAGSYGHSILKASNSITRLLSRRQAQHAFSHLTTRGRVAVQHIPQSVCMWRLERDAGKLLVIALSNGWYSYELAAGCSSVPFMWVRELNLLVLCHNLHSLHCRSLFYYHMSSPSWAHAASSVHGVSLLSNTFHTNDFHSSTRGFIFLTIKLNKKLSIKQ